MTPSILNKRQVSFFNYYNYYPAVQHRHRQSKTWLFYESHILTQHLIKFKINKLLVVQKSIKIYIFVLEFQGRFIDRFSKLVENVDLWNSNTFFIFKTHLLFYIFNLILCITQSLCNSPRYSLQFTLHRRRWEGHQWLAHHHWHLHPKPVFLTDVLFFVYPIHDKWVALYVNRRLAGKTGSVRKQGQSPPPSP